MWASVHVIRPDFVTLNHVCFLAAVLFALSMVVINAALGLYRANNHLGLTQVLLRRTIALAIGLPVVYVVFSILPESNLYFGSLKDGLLLAAATVTGVAVVQQRNPARDFLTHKLLVVGSAQDADFVKRSLSDTQNPGIAVVGLYPPKKIEDAKSTAGVAESTQSLLTMVKKLGVKEIVVAAREQRGGVLPLGELVDCRLNGVKVTCLPTFFEHYQRQVHIHSLKASWLIYGDGFRQGWARSTVKRTFDVLVSATLLVATLPIMILTALAIAIESSGPVIYRQKRVGAKGEVFRILKFRSMRTDAEADSAPQWAAKEDPRVTKVGRFIRKTRIDELPQLINVLKGQMSLVGPRPERPYFVEQLKTQIPFYGARHSVKPGITGWAQIRYPYAASVNDAVKKLQYDLYYVKNHTLLLDIVIVLDTIRVVLQRDGAR